MRRILLLLLPAWLLAAHGSDRAVWAPVPAEVWAMKEDPAHGVQGAMVLEDKYEVEESKTIRTYRVRILSDQGREAADLFLFTGDSPRIEGHTLYPDGTSVTFDSLKDFSIKPKYRNRWVEAKRTAVVAPGINGNCVFEARWEEPPLGRSSARFTYYLGGRFPTRRAVIEIAKGLQRSCMVVPGKGIRSEAAEEPAFRRFTLMDLPSQDEIPFSLKTTMDLPRILIFTRQMTRTLSRRFAKEPDPRKRADLFWSEYAAEDLKGQFESGWHTGDAYRALRGSLFKDLPQAPHARASALLMRLNAQIRNRDQSTFAEVTADKGVHNYSEWLDYQNMFKVKNLEVISELGVTTKFGMQFMYYHLLEEAGLKPLIGLVANRNLLLLDYATLDTNQYTHMLFGVEEAGKGVLWLDPTLRFVAPGLILPEFQGTIGAMVDTATWKASSFSVPVQPALVNQSRYQYRITLDDDGEAFSVSAEFSGIPEYLARNRLLPLDVPGQDRLLKEDLEQGLKSLSFSRTEVFHAHDPHHNLAWKAEGHLDADPGRIREIQPFPAMPSPMEIPGAFPPSRTEPILIPYQSVQLAASWVEVPSGYRFPASDPFSRQNRFGSVNRVAALETRDGKPVVRVVLRVDVTGFFEPASVYGELREFCGWVQEACGKTIVLEPAR